MRKIISNSRKPRMRIWKVISFEVGYTVSFTGFWPLIFNFFITSRSFKPSSSKSPLMISGSTSQFAWKQWYLHLILSIWYDTYFLDWTPIILRCVEHQLRDALYGWLLSSLPSASSSPCAKINVLFCSTNVSNRLN